MTCSARGPATASLSTVAARTLDAQAAAVVARANDPRLRAVLDLHRLVIDASGSGRWVRAAAASTVQTPSLPNGRAVPGL